MIRLIFSSYTGFAAADWLSDKYLKKQNRLDYGILNQFLGRKTVEPWWGTRLEHTVTLPAYLTLADIVSAKFWQSYARRKRKTFGIKGTPLAYLFHCYAFVHVGVMAYVVHNAYLNPSVEDSQKFIMDHLIPVTVGDFTMLAFPFTASVTGKIAAALPILRWVLCGALGGALHFVGVKALGFKDHVIPDALTDLEKEFNGFVDDIEGKPDDDV